MDENDSGFPQPGDLPLKEPGFCLYARGDWLAHALAFQKAGDALAAHAMEVFQSGDLLVHPISFLYRHHIELCLKDILCLDGSPVRRTHSLEALWRDCRALLTELGISVDLPDVPETDDFENCINQLQQYDAYSDSFRYPFAANGAPNLQAIESVDVEHLSKIMDRMAMYLDCVRESVASAYGVEHY
jgi:HEPN domain-containing protein